MTDVAEPRDHAPLLMVLYATAGGVDYRPQEVRLVDRDVVMRCMTRGERREEYVGVVEAALKEKEGIVSECLLQHPVLDAAWREVVQAVNQVTQEVFPRRPKEDSLRRALSDGR